MSDSIVIVKNRKIGNVVNMIESSFLDADSYQSKPALLVNQSFCHPQRRLNLVRYLYLQCTMIV